jgi:hypothetical protein
MPLQSLMRVCLLAEQQIKKLFSNNGYSSTFTTNMNNHFKSIILQKTGASSLAEKEVIQELCSGYGKIIRVALENPDLEITPEDGIQISGIKEN